MIGGPTPSSVIFDFYGTLTIGTSMVERDVARHAVGDALGIEATTFATAVRDSFDARARGRTGDAIATLRWLASRCAAAPTEAEIERAWQTRLDVERSFMAPRPGALEVLAGIKQAGLRIGVLSDCTHELPLCWPDLSFDEFVDAAIFSVETGMRKPDPAMYAEICRRLDVASTDCLYVGDGGSNELSGARAIGMRAIQIRGPEFATAHTYDAETAWDGEIIADLRELFVVLDIEAHGPQGSNAKIPAQPQRVRSAGEA